MRRILAALCLSVFGFLAASQAARADIIYSDLGSPPSVEDEALVLYPLDNNNNSPITAAFASLCACDLSQIDLALRTDDGSESSVGVSLWTSVSGLPGAELGNWTITGIADTDSAVFTINGITGISLGSATSYFLEVSFLSGKPSWNENGQGVSGTFCGPQFCNVNVVQFPAFDLLSTSVPEPASLLVFGSALLSTAGFVAMRRRKRIRSKA